MGTSGRGGDGGSGKAGGGAPPGPARDEWDVTRRLRDIQVNQAFKRQTGGLFDKWELGEIGAVRDLARETFGRLGYGALVEANQDEPGLVGIGYYTEPPGHARPNATRGRVIVCKGASHRELVEQVREWKWHAR